MQHFLSPSLVSPRSQYRVGGVPPQSSLSSVRKHPINPFIILSRTSFSPLNTSYSPFFLSTTIIQRWVSLLFCPHAPGLLQITFLVVDTIVPSFRKLSSFVHPALASVPKIGELTSSEASPFPIPQDVGVNMVPP